MADVLGPEFCKVYTAVKSLEYSEFLQVISPWEREHLLLSRHAPGSRDWWIETALIDWPGSSSPSGSGPTRHGHALRAARGPG
jgi:hypothetical protein